MDSYGNPTVSCLSSASWEGRKRMAPCVIADQGGRGRRPTVRVREIVVMRNGSRQNRYRTFVEGEAGGVMVATVARKQFPMLMFEGGGTVHRFQGVTLNTIGIDCSGDLRCYCDGMMYVALSRVKRLEHRQIASVEDVIARIRSCHVAVEAYQSCIARSQGFRDHTRICRYALRE